MVNFFCKMICAVLILESTQLFAFEEIRVSLEKMPSSINPTEIREIEGHFIQRQIFETLIEKSDRGVYLPVLAESWKISSNMRSFSLRLKSNIKFSDGSELFADDIVKVVELQGSKFTSRAIEGLDDFINGRTKKIKGLIKTSPHEVFFNFTEPFPQILDELSTEIMPIFKKIGSKYLGTGPFKVDEKRWQGKDIILERNSHYVRNSSHIKKISFSTTEKDANIVLKQEPNYLERKWVKVPYFVAETHFIGFNLQSTEFKSKRYRQAIGDILRRSLDAQGQREVRGIIPLGLPGYDPTLAPVKNQKLTAASNLWNDVEIEYYLDAHKIPLEKFCKLFVEESHRKCSLKKTTVAELFSEKNSKRTLFAMRFMPGYTQEIMELFEKKSTVNVFYPNKKIQSQIDEIIKESHAAVIESKKIEKYHLFQELIESQALEFPFSYGGNKYFFADDGLIFPTMSLGGPYELKLMDLKWKGNKK